MPTLNIPDKLYKDFLDLLDSTQSQYTQEDLEDMSPDQVELINFISQIVGEKATPRVKTIKQQRRVVTHHIYSNRLDQTFIFKDLRIHDVVHSLCNLGCAFLYSRLPTVLPT